MEEEQYSHLHITSWYLTPTVDIAYVLRNALVHVPKYIYYITMPFLHAAYINRLNRIASC